MLSLWLLWVVRLLHILAGTFWVGGALLMARFLFPSARALGAAAGPMMDQLNRVRNLPRALLGAGTVTVLAGFVLYWHDSVGMGSAWPESSMGRWFGFGGLCATIALIVGFAVNAPTVRKLSALSATLHAQGAPPNSEQSAEMQRLQGRLGKGVLALSLLLVLATSAMAVARYMP